jgi:LmbE family N-acetylglucosaminyl deacetylase
VIILRCLGDEVVATEVMYLSPHLDDVALSCGGLIHRQAQAGIATLVTTVFAGAPPRSELSPLAAELHAQWGDLAEPVAARREEDKKAMRLLGTDCRHLEYPDAIYRFDDVSALYLSDEQLYGYIHSSDLQLIRQIAETIMEVCSPQPSTIYAPLGVGNHVDHQLVRGAALVLLRRSCPVIFSVDYPYVEVPGALTRELDLIGTGEWSEEVQDLHQEDVAMKIEAIAAYASQMDKLFEGADVMAQRVRDYAFALSSSEGYGERYWSLSRSTKYAIR